MTATSYRHQSTTVPHGRSAIQHPRFRRIYLLASIGLCEVAGMAALVRAYYIAGTTVTSTPEFAWFWAGMFLLLLPIAVVIVLRKTPQTTRTALLILYGLVSYAPKLLRNPSSPLYHDEYAHWRATYEILSTGRLFEPDPMVPIIARYPGLHAATAALVNATGLTIWQAATLLLIFLHVTLILGLAVLAQSLGLGNRNASIVAIIYSLNSSFLYFDTQYAYESMAITLLVWTLVAYVRAIRSPSREGRIEWGALTVVLSAGTVITHHLSTFTLIVIMTLVSVVLSVRPLAQAEGWVRATAVTAWSLTLATALLAGAWFTFVAPSTWSYLSPYLGKGLSELMQTAGGSGGSRQLFGASLSPWWEQKSAYLASVFAVGLAAGGLLLIWHRIRGGRLPRGRRRAFLIAFTLFGLVYFPSTIFIFSPDGAEGARRSWAFTWIGFSILAGPVAVWLVIGQDAGRAHGYAPACIRDSRSLLPSLSWAERRQVWMLPIDSPARSSTALTRVPSHPNYLQRANGSRHDLVQAIMLSLIATQGSSSARSVFRTPFIRPASCRFTTCTWPSRAPQSSPRI